MKTEYAKADREKGTVFYLFFGAGYRWLMALLL